jgi:hypothetical protein
MAQDLTPPRVFFSYSHDSGEHKNWVLLLAARLRSNGVDAVLDQWNLTLGSDLASFMERGLSKSNRVICICSEAYIRKANEGKGGAGYEKQIITSELVQDQNTNWVIPLIRNNSSLRKTPTFLSGRLYISFEDDILFEANYETLLRDILDERVLPIPPIGKNPFKTIREFAQQNFLPLNDKYVSPATGGVIPFDYSNNDGRYSIGQDELMFELHFSKGSDRQIYILNDPISIRTVALVKDVADISRIEDARIYDGSSRHRSPMIDQIVVLQNENGFYAAVKILALKDDTRGASHDEIVFEYKIQTNGSPNFTS